MMAKGVCATGGAVLSLVVVGCGLKEAAPFDPRDLQRVERARATETPVTPMRPLPTTLETFHPTEREIRSATYPSSSATTQPNLMRALGDGPTVRLSLQEIVQRSVANSDEVRVSGYDPAIAETRIIEAQARFDPVMFANVSWDHTDQQTAGQPDLFGNVIDKKFGQILEVQRGDIYTMEPGVKQLLPSGGEAQISYQVQQLKYEPRTSVLNPYWQNELKFQLTQPLLRDFGYDVNQARITIAQNDQRVSVLDFRKTLEGNIFEIEKDFWDLTDAEAEVRIQEELLDRTRQTADILIRQFEAGKQGVSRVQTSQATASIRAREALLISARARVFNISDDLKRRMNDPEFPVTAPVAVLPGNGPIESPIEFDQGDLIATAMDNRLELGQQQLRINSAGVAQLVAKDNLLPKFDLKAQAILQGLAGDESRSAYNQALDTHASASLGLQFELPIGNREAGAIYRRARLQRMQAIEQYRFLVSQVSEDVTTALRDVLSSWEQIGARRQARFAFSDQLLALEQREAQGEPLDPTYVQLKLDTQERFADSEREEALAIANYNTAIAKLEQAKGTLLRYNNVVMQEENLPGSHRLH